MRALQIIPALSFSVLALAACNMSAMPTLYHYHTDEYRSPPGPDAPDIGYEYTVEKNAQTVAAWNGMIENLVNKLEAGNAMQPQSVYLVPHTDRSTFMNMYEHALRKALNDRGYTLMNEYSPDATFFFYEAAPIVEPKIASAGPNSEELAKTKAGVHAKPVAFRLVVVKSLKTLGTAESTYEMPLYGYQGGMTTVYPADILLQMMPPPPPPEKQAAPAQQQAPAAPPLNGLNP